MHGGREAPLDAEIVEQHLGHGGEAIGRARGVRDELMTGGIVLLLVDPQDDRDVRILGGRRDHHFLGPGLEVLGRGRLVPEDAGGLDHDVHPELAPGQCRGVLGGAHAHLAAIDDLGVEDAVDGVVLEQVGQGLGIRQVIDGDHLELRRRERRAEKDPADTPESVDADSHTHDGLLDGDN